MRSTDIITSHSFSISSNRTAVSGNAADAEDAVQDTLLSALTHVNQYKGRAKMSKGCALCTDGGWEAGA